MKPLITILGALLALPAAADTLSDLKSAVSRLGAKQPVRATYATEQAVKAAGRFSNKKNNRTLSIEVSHDPSGVAITVPQTLLDQASQASRNGSDENAAQYAIGGIRAASVVEALDFHDHLLKLLNYGDLTEEKRVLYKGKQARMLVLKLRKQPKDRNSISLGTVKAHEDRLNVWVGEDNIPLAAERVMRTKASFMMLFNGETSSRTGYTFAHAADRLVLARLETTSSGSGMGQKIDESSVQTVTVH